MQQEQDMGNKSLNIFFIFITLGFINSTYAQTGIGTSTPVNKFQVEAATADPATSGASANGNFRLSGTTGSQVLDFGLSSSSTYSWLQSRSRSGYGTNYNLLLNPNGGNIGIGNFSPDDKLVIGSSMAFHDGGDKVIGLGWSPGSSKALLTSYPAEIRLEPGIGRLSFGTSSTSYTTGATVSVQQRMAITSQGYVGIGNNSPSATLEIGSSSGSVPGYLVLNPTTTGTGVEGAEIDFRPAPVTTSPAAQTWVIDQVSDANNPRLRTSNAPMPGGPPSLCAETAIISASGSGSFPALCEQSAKNIPSKARTAAVISAIGWITPVSLFTDCTANRALPEIAPTSTCPSAPTGKWFDPVTANTASCSTALATAAVPLSPSAIASLAPLVRMTSPSQSSAAAIRLRASSSAKRAALPS